MTRFPANDPGNAKQFKVGIALRAVAIDSQGNAWVANTVGHPDTVERLALIKAKLESKVESLSGSMSKAQAEAEEWIDLFEILEEHPGGDVSIAHAVDRPCPRPVDLCRAEIFVESLSLGWKSSCRQRAQSRTGSETFLSRFPIGRLANPDAPR